MRERLIQLQEFLKESPQDPFLKYALAAEYLKLGELSQGQLGFEELVEQHPDYVGTYYHLGKLYEKINLREQAQKTYLKGMEIARAKRNRHALSELQGAYNLLNGDFDEEDEY